MYFLRLGNEGSTTPRGQRPPVLSKLSYGGIVVARPCLGQRSAVVSGNVEFELGSFHLSIAIDNHFGIEYSTIMSSIQIVIDTNIVIGAFYSRHGYAYDLMTQLDSEDFEINLSTPLILEYEEVSKRMLNKLGLTEEDIDAVIDYICSVGNPHEIFYLWRPFLKDPKDDMVLELAVAGNCDYIVTYNLKDFVGIDTQFGISAVTPDQFLQRIGKKK